jgi:hypothetical protein
MMSSRHHVITSSGRRPGRALLRLRVRAHRLEHALPRQGDDAIISSCQHLTSPHLTSCRDKNISGAGCEDDIGDFCASWRGWEADTFIFAVGSTLLTVTLNWVLRWVMAPPSRPAITSPHLIIIASLNSAVLVLRKAMMVMTAFEGNHHAEDAFGEVAIKVFLAQASLGLTGATG